jgi:hypothetical protein
MIVVKNAKYFSTPSDKYTLKHLDTIPEMYDYTVKALLEVNEPELVEQYTQLMLKGNTNIFHIVYDVDHQRTLSEYYVQIANREAKKRKK